MQFFRWSQTDGAGARSAVGIVVAMLLQTIDREGTCDVCESWGSIHRNSSWALGGYAVVHKSWSSVEDVTRSVLR